MVCVPVLDQFLQLTAQSAIGLRELRFQLVNDFMVAGQQSLFRQRTGVHIDKHPIPVNRAVETGRRIAGHQYRPGLEKPS